MQPAKASPHPALPTALLLHTLPEGSHYDWLIALPGRERLWTARVADPCSRWRSLRTWPLYELPPHRREYLTYEGPVSGDRGTVQRVDEGTVSVESWNEGGAVLDVAMRHFRGRVRLTRVDGAAWRADLA